MASALGRSLNRHNQHAQRYLTFILTRSKQELSYSAPAYKFDLQPVELCLKIACYKECIIMHGYPSYQSVKM